jgi:tetratricopeptide (TPR) repeat protein
MSALNAARLLPPGRIMSRWISWALPKHWTWTQEHLGEEIASRAAACVSPHSRVDQVWGSFEEPCSLLRRWQRIACHCLKIMPDNVDGWIALGHAEFRLACHHHTRNHERHYEASKRAYRVAAKLKGDARSWISFGEVCVASGDLKGQFLAFKTALEIVPGDTSALWRLGVAHATAGEHQEAAVLLRRAIERLAEGSGWVYVDLGRSELCLGNMPEAIDAFFQAGTLGNGDAFNTLCPQIAESFYGHDQAAVELRDRLSEVNPSLADRFFAFFQPKIGTVIRAKGYWRIKTDILYNDYFISMQEIEAAGIAKLRAGDQVEFKTIGRRVLPSHFRLLPRAE